MVQHMATALDQVVVTLASQVTKQQETNALLFQLLPQAGAMEQAAVPGAGGWAGEH